MHGKKKASSTRSAPVTRSEQRTAERAAPLAPPRPPRPASAPARGFAGALSRSDGILLGRLTTGLGNFNPCGPLSTVSTSFFSDLFFVSPASF